MLDLHGADHDGRLFRVLKTVVIGGHRDSECVGTKSELVPHCGELSKMSDQIGTRDDLHGTSDRTWNLSDVRKDGRADTE